MIASEFHGADKAKYSKAAEQVRIPYWDFAKEGPLPPILTTPVINVTKPGTKKAKIQEIPNPLYQYNFTCSATIAKDFPGPFVSTAYSGVLAPS